MGRYPTAPGVRKAPSALPAAGRSTRSTAMADDGAARAAPRWPRWRDTDRSEAPRRLNHPVFTPPGAVITPAVDAQIQEDLCRHGDSGPRVTYGLTQYRKFLAAIRDIYHERESTLKNCSALTAYGHCAICNNDPDADTASNDDTGTPDWDVPVKAPPPKRQRGARDVPPQFKRQRGVTEIAALDT